MAILETDKFIVTDIKHKYAQSNELSARPKPPQKVGVESLTSECKICKHKWRASSYGEGKLMHSLGHVGIECPSCGNSEQIRGSAFNF